jgi:hypothetical protein
MNRVLKGKKIIFSLIFILLGGVMMGCGKVQSQGKTEGPVQLKMEKYIKEAYKEDFVVEVPMHHTDEGGISDYYHAVAYPKKDKSLKFEIDYSGGKLSDTYMDVKWSKEGSIKLGNNLNWTYGEKISYYFELNEETNASTRKMSYSQVIANNPNKGYMNIVYYVFLDGDLNKQKEAEKVYEILKPTVLDNKIRTYELAVYFIDNKYKDYFIKNRTGDGMLDDDNLYKSRKLINVIYSIAVDNIKNKDDLMKRFKY